MPAIDCDLDHRTPLADGGATAEHDLSPLGHTDTTEDQPPLTGDGSLPGPSP